MKCVLLNFKLKYSLSKLRDYSAWCTAFAFCQCINKRK